MAVSDAERVALQQAGQYAGRRGQDILTPENAQDVGLLPERGFVARGVPDSQPQISAPPEVLESRTDPSSGMLLGPSTLQPGDTQEKPSPVAPISNWIDAALGQPGRLEGTMKRLQPDQNGQSKEPSKIQGAVLDDPKPDDKPTKIPGAVLDDPQNNAAPAQIKGAVLDDPKPSQPLAQTPPSISPPPPANLPPSIPTPTPESAPPDPHELQQVLVAQGLTAGQAQAVAAGQIPKTLSGDTPPPPTPPKTQAVVPQAPAPQTTTYIAPPLINGKAPVGSDQPSTQPLPPSEPQKPSDLQPAAVAQPAAVKPIVTMIPAITGSYTPATDRSIKGIVIHSSDGNEKSDIQTLTGHDPSHLVSSHYYVTQNGKVYQFVADGDIAWHAGQTSGKYANYNNSNTIGIEQEHVDGKPWSEAEVKATAGLVASLQKKYGLSNGNTLGHSDVAPERKQDPYNYPWDRFHQYVQDAGGASDKGGPAALAPSTPLSKEDAGAVAELGKAGLHVTRFGYQGDSTPDPDSAKGSGKWIEHMKPGYDVALNNAAWELVGKPKPGSVFTYGGREWRYGDQVPERYSDARFDIYDKDGQFAAIGGEGGGKASGSKGGTGQIAGDQNAPVPQPMWALPNSSPAGETRSPQPETPSFGGGGGGGASHALQRAPESSFYLPVEGGGGGGRGGGQAAAEESAPSAPPSRSQPQQMSARDITPEQSPLVTALMNRGFSQQQALNYAQSSANVAPGKGVPAINVKGPAPAAPGLPAPLGTTLSLAQAKPKAPIQIAPVKPGKVPPIVPQKGPAPAAPSAKKPLQLTGPSQQAQPQAQAPKVDPSVVLGLMKRGFSREQAMAVASKATVSKGIGETASFRPPPAKVPVTDSASMRPLGFKAAVQLPSGEIHTGSTHDAAYKQAGHPPEEDTEFGFAKGGQFTTMDEADKLLAQHHAPQPFGRPPGSTHGDPNPKGLADAIAGLKPTAAAKAHAAVLSDDDPRVRKQADGYVKGEHFVEGDPFHEQLLSGLPYGKQGHQRGLLAQAETAIADKSPMHISYISAPKEAAKFPTRETRTTQYDEHSPEARLMGTTEGQLVGHSFIPLAAGVKLSTKAGEPHQSYLQGISTNVMANNFQHVNDKLAAMGRKSPYKEMGAKFQNDLEGYYSNLLAGHTATGRGYVAGTEHHPMEPDREHVPYKLSRKEADFIGTVINNTAAFAKHDDAKAIRELARVNGSLITEKGETNRMRHDIEEHEPGWRERVLEPTIRSFKTGLIHEIHPSEEHMPMEIRPGKHYQSLTKSIARTSERGRPDIAIAAGLHHNFEDNRKINEIERDFSDHKIEESMAKTRLKALGEDPDEYRFVGGSGGLITPYEEDPEALTPEEHDTMKNNLRQAWVGGKMNVEDYRKKAAEVPLPQKPSKNPRFGQSATRADPQPTPKPVTTTAEPVEAPEAPPVPKPIAPKPPKPPKPVAPPKPETTKQLDPSRVKNSYEKSGDKVHWLPTDEVDKRWQKDEGFHIPPGGTKNTIGKRYENAKEYLQGNQPVNAPRASVDETGKISMVDGRHRLAAMRDLGHEKVPLALTDDSHENAAKTGLTEPSEPAAPPKQAPAPDEPLPPVKKPKAAPEAPLEAPRATALEKPSWKTANEKTRQAYLKQRVAHDMERQYKGADAHQLEVDRNEEDNSIKYDPAGNPIYKKVDYDLANSPLLKKKGLNQLKGADEHPDTLGNLIGPDGKEVIDPDTGKPVLKHTHLNQVERSRLSAMHTASAVHTMGNKIVDEFMKIKDQPEIMAGEGWYSRMRKKLADALGEHHELFAQLLGATSAKTPVRNNFIQSLDALEQFKQGKFDNHIKKYQEAFGKMQEGKGALVQHMKNQGIPLYDKDGNTVDTHDTDAAAMANWIHHHGILPRQQIQEGQEEGSKYNANSVAVLRALAGTWLKEIGAPKTPNFAGNLTGRTLEATIDVWAARFLKRLGYEGQAKGPWRSQGKSEPGVNSLDFAFSQDAMRHAADEITKRTGKKMNPDDLQAIAWFAEKHHWEKQGWTRGAGAEKSSFDDVADLAFPKTGEPMTSADLRKHYGALQEEAKRVKARVKTAKNYVGHADPKMRAKLEPYMEKHGLTHEQVHGPEVEEEDEDAA